MILCENIEDVSRLAFGYDKITSINLGGIKNEAGKRQISKALSVNDEEIELLKKQMIKVLIGNSYGFR